MHGSMKVKKSNVLYYTKVQVSNMGRVTSHSEISSKSACFTSPSPEFLTLGSTKWCHGFHETKMRNSRRILLAVLNLYVPIRIRVATLNTNHSVVDSMQTINPEASRFCSPVSEHSSSIDSRCVRQNNQVIGQFEVSRWFFTCNVHER